MEKRISRAHGLIIIASFFLIAVGVVLLFQQSFRTGEEFAGDKRIEEISKQNFMLPEEEIEDIANRYITEKRAIGVAEEAGLKEGDGWMVSFHFVENSSYEYVWAVTGTNTEEETGEQLLIDAVTEEVLSSIEISI